MLSTVLGMLLLLLPLVLAFWMWWRHGRFAGVTAAGLAWVLGGGMAGGVIDGVIEAFAYRVTGLTSVASQVGVASALLTVLLFAAPLSEAFKVGVVWPLYRTRRITQPLLGLFFAAAVGAAFASGRVAHFALTEKFGWLPLLRLFLGIPAHVFFAGAWGYALGSGRARGRWFSSVWLVAVVLHAFYQHIVFGRGPGLLVGAAPLLLAMAVASWIVLRDLDASRESKLPSSRTVTIFPTLPNPPSIRAVRQALSRSDRPLMVHWIVIGTLVTVGLLIVCLSAAVYAGHQLGVDFTLADEGDVRSSGPLVLLGVAFLAAFPLAGYLVARASSATSVLEPALGAGLAIATVVAVVTLAAPVIVVFALAAAPVAFALACGGSWFGLAR